MFKMMLNVKERINIGNFLPMQSDFLTMQITKNIQDKLSISNTEEKEIEFKKEVSAQNPRGTYRWNEKGLIDKEFDFSEIEKSLVWKLLKDLNDNNKIVIGLLSIYDKFSKI